MIIFGSKIYFLLWVSESYCEFQIYCDLLTANFCEFHFTDCPSEKFTVTVSYNLALTCHPVMFMDTYLVRT